MSPAEGDAVRARRRALNGQVGLWRAALRSSPAFTSTLSAFICSDAKHEKISASKVRHHQEHPTVTRSSQLNNFEKYNNASSKQK
jgi:hypothetical protein